MTTEALLVELENRGVTLFLKDGGLRFRAAKGAFTPELQERVRDEREGLMAFLRERAATQVPPASAPLTLLQSYLLAWMRRFPHFHDYPLYFALRIGGCDVADPVEAALVHLAGRHDALRTRFETQDGVVVQVIDPPGAFALERHDLTRLGDAEQEAEALRLAEDLAYRPVALDSPDLFRAASFRFGGGRQAVIVALTHMLSDFYTVQLLKTEFIAAFRAAVAGDAPTLEPVGIQYWQYALEEARTMPRTLENHLPFWAERLAGAPPYLPPVDRPRSGVQTHLTPNVMFGVPSSVLARLRGLARAQRTTMAIVLNAAFQAMLARWSGQTDIVSQRMVLGRDLTRLQRMAGMCVGGIPIRTDLSDGPSFRRLIDRMKAGAREEHAHPGIPLATLVERLRPEPPFCRMLFNFLPGEWGPIAIPPGADGLSFEEFPFPLELRGVPNEMTLFMLESANALNARLSYMSELFDRGTIDHFVERFLVLLDAASADPDNALAMLAA